MHINLVNKNIFSYFNGIKSDLQIIMFLFRIELRSKKKKKIKE